MVRKVSGRTAERGDDENGMLRHEISFRPPTREELAFAKRDTLSY